MSSSSFANSTHSPLDARVRQVGHRSERLLLCYGISRFLSVLLISGFVCGMADYLLRSQERGMRFIFSTLFAVAVLGAFFRYVRPVLGCRSSNLDVAQRIERRFPQLRDTLSSAIAFLHRNGEFGGSSDLEGLVIADAGQRIDKLDLMDCLDTRAPQRAAIVTLIMLAGIAGVCYANPEQSFLAARRLLMPWSQNAWPRWNTLSFQSPPRKLAAGADFEAELIDLAGHLPDRVTIQYWFAGALEGQIESRPMRRVAGRMVDRYSNVGRTFKYRAFGGDDDTMPWMQVDLVQPPEIEELQARIEPPAYSRLPTRATGPEFRVLEGSAITVMARVSKAISIVEVEHSWPDLRSSLRPTIAADGMSFVFPGDGQQLIAAESSVIGFRVVDADGIASVEPFQCEMQVAPDYPPAVTIDSPLEGAAFTVEARVPLRLLVRDDLAIDSVNLHFSGQSVELHRARTAPPLIAQPDRRETDTAADRSDTWPIEHAWELRSIAGLEVGDTLEYEIVASDFLPQSGSSGIRRLSIVSVDDLTRQFARRRERLRQSLQEVLAVQRSANDQLQQLRRRAADVERWDQEEIDAAQSVALHQRHVNRLAIEGSGSIAMTITQLLRDISSNGLEAAMRADQLSKLSGNLRDGGRDELIPAGDQLASAARIARRGSDSRDPVDAELFASLLAESTKLQIAAADRFEQMIDSLARQGDVREVRMMLSELQRAQRSVSDQTSSSATIGRDLRSLDLEQQADLANLAEEQREQVRKFGQLLSSVGSLAERTASAQPDISAALRDVLRTAEVNTVSGLFREAARSIERNRIGKAVEQQSRIEKSLDRMAQVVGANNSRQSTGRSQGEARDQLQLRESLVELRNRQLDLAAVTRELAATANVPAVSPRPAFSSLAIQQQQLADEIQELATHLESASILASLIERVHAEMGDAANMLGQEAPVRRTEEVQRRAAWRLKIAIDSLERQPTTTNDAGERANQGSPQPTDAGPTLDAGELRLLLALQEDIRRRTEEYSVARVTVPREQLEALAEEQAWLAARLRQLAQ